MNFSHIILDLENKIFNNYNFVFININIYKYLCHNVSIYSLKET